ncbi:hypothetical protein L227DRAFT_613476 [Lentinus tigrinus ALCF2SS1-6]|uniref:Uncharacterized protein n=1 Tax=Lentinus tigrinus ALCF2SS1-6 TaxID=1328759 RepID=A0A5C2S2X1_9APHY|nr:hypothetical protein L227DRAFT_613476 [Lentinus tigrinus ALCF2SS1-6]
MICNRRSRILILAANTEPMTPVANHRYLRRSMHGKITVMPYTTFMDHFVPDPRISNEPLGHPCRIDVFKGMTKPRNEKEIYREIPKRLNATERPCRGFVVVSTPHKADSTSSSKIAPGCGIYPNGHAPKITIECKRNFAQDPFDDTAANAEPFAQARRSSLEQILSYAELVF